MAGVYVGLLAIAAIFPVSAAGSDDIEDCAEMADDARRLECYDRAASAESAGEAREAAPASAPATLADAPAEAASPDAQDSFGLDEEREAEEQEPDQISARITKIESRRNGERLFTLDNGQVWAEDAPKPSLRLEVGDTVTIKAGLFGSHRLFGSGNRSSGVDRVR